MNDSSDIERLFESKGHERVGIADPALLLFPDVIKKLSCPVVLLTRDARSCIADLIAMGSEEHVAVSYVEKMERAVERMKALPGVMTVDAAQVKTRRIAQQMFWHCLPGFAFDEVRFGLLALLLIEANPLLSIAAARNNVSGMQRLFKDRYEHLGTTLQ
jgi:hypothetical protein